MGISKINKNKDFSLEVIRIIAAFFVIFNHTGENGYVLFASYDIYSFQFWLYMPISVICKIAVPLFFMISGILLLGREESYRDLFKKRISKILITLFVFSVIYYVVDILNGKIAFYGLGNILDFFAYLFAANIKYHLWFLYSYFIFLLLLPSLRKLVLVLKKKDYNYLFALALIVMIIKPIFERLLFEPFELAKYFDFLIDRCVLYPLVGYYINKYVKINEISNKKWFFILGINVILIAVTCFFTFYRILKTGEIKEYQVQYFQNMFMVINASSVLITVKKFVKFNNKSAFKKIVGTIGSCTFGIYLMHVLLLENPYFIQLEDKFIQLVFDPMLGELIYCLLIFIICFIVSFIIKKIPIVNKLI